MSDITPLEAAEKLEELSAKLAKQPETWKQMICLVAASYLRAIAAGEYKRVVHAHIVGRGWDLHCSNCGASADIGNDYCPDCGARMDGKGDSRVKKRSAHDTLY